jgi:HEPN domain-containing protein
MPHDPARVADTKEWLARAADDLKAAELLLRASPALCSTAVFHCQQAAEKAMKGFLAWHDVPFRKTHDLEQIGEACLAIDSILKEIVDRAVPLTEYAWKFRYPGQPQSPSLKETEAAVTLARELYGAIVTRLPEEVRP